MSPGVDGHVTQCEGLGGGGGDSVVHATVGLPVGQGAVVGDAGHEEVVLWSPIITGLHHHGASPTCMIRRLTIALGECHRKFNQSSTRASGPWQVTVTRVVDTETIERTIIIRVTRLNTNRTTEKYLEVSEDKQRRSLFSY